MRRGCAWAGVPLEREEVKHRAQQFETMVDGFGSLGIRHLRGRRARGHAEEWIRGIIQQVRTGTLTVDDNSALGIMALQMDINGIMMDIDVAAVELINVLRAVVAISTYVTFSALALHRYPFYRQMLREDFEGLAENFVHEVRRFYPFGPFVGARVRDTFSWKDATFEKGMLVLLDIYGINHDPSLWNEPEMFKPERFHNWNGSPFNFIPQGGGDYYNGHRCAGERITIAVTKLSLKYLTLKIRYHVPIQDLSFSLSRIPTFPRSGFVMTGIVTSG